MTRNMVAAMTEGRTSHRTMAVTTIYYFNKEINCYDEYYVTRETGALRSLN